MVVTAKPDFHLTTTDLQPGDICMFPKRHALHNATWRFIFVKILHYYPSEGYDITIYWLDGGMMNNFVEHDVVFDIWH